MWKLYSQEYIKASEERKEEIASVLSEIFIDMQSYITRWHLQNSKNKKILNQNIIQNEVEELMKSKIFKQGYELDELADYEFSLFYPVKVALNQFSDNYDELMGYISK